MTLVPQTRSPEGGAGFSLSSNEAQSVTNNEFLQSKGRDMGIITMANSLRLYSLYSSTFPHYTRNGVYVVEHLVNRDKAQ